MIGSDLIRKIRNLAGTTSELGSLQIQLYLHEMREARRNIFIIMALGFVAATLFLACVSLSLVAVVVLLAEAGYSTAVAISITVGIAALLFIVITACAVLLAKRQVQRLETPNRELKANFATVRDQLVKSLSEGNPSI